ncbi:hypothetical protein F3L20_21220 [Streptomyces tendae]|uniref:Uncharacterized protein n=1 Tax=Streptomyces tendae TaxID=1932 RepID=A0ABX5ZTM3_STRTE|nr:hypothetical protein F3L20_21220 [Streptomyces tendae]
MRRSPGPAGPRTSAPRPRPAPSPPAAAAVPPRRDPEPPVPAPAAPARSPRSGSAGGPSPADVSSVRAVAESAALAHSPSVPRGRVSQATAAPVRATGHSTSPATPSTPAPA